MADLKELKASQSTDWGSGPAGNFISKVHHEPNETVDPSKVKLRHPFVVCIVGGSRGIGAGIAYSYAKAGASGLVLAARRTSGLDETAANCKKIKPDIDVETVPCDITSSESVAALAEKTKAKFGRLDVVAVNSGYAGPVVLKVTETDPDTFRNAINVNYVGTFLCAKYLIPLLLETPDGIKAFVAVSSFASLLVRGPIANAQYCVSKLSQLKLMELIHEKFHNEGISAYSIHPGAVKSEMAEEGAPEMFKPFLIDSAELCGSWCVWLTKDGDKSSWISGRLLSANYDADEVEAKKDEIVEKDLLKLRLTLP